ncbi:gamma-glutamylcyclotransferase [Natrialbaceae archaeon GCM10025810]|uniref:gamma-glutamylcyclotransferase family protein n=1 Tax=Halovalidus salilacus TaxID=3075124 RepID=UPI00360FD999
MDETVFVYGTLTDPDRVEAAFANDSRTEPAYEFRGRAVLEGMHRLEGRYPTLAPGGSVEGRLLAVDERGLEILDRYEGVDRGLYVRISIPRADGEEPVWTYVGEPKRLGIDDPAGGPEGDPDSPSGSDAESTPFAERVRKFRSRSAVVIRPLE